MKSNKMNNFDLFQNQNMNSNNNKPNYKVDKQRASNNSMSKLGNQNQNNMIGSNINPNNAYGNQGNNNYNINPNTALPM
jgi:hypothetical protein